MSKLPQVPLADAPEQYSQVLDIDSTTNFADDEDSRMFVIENILPILDACRDEREGLEEVWREVDEIDAMKHNAGRKYVGRSNYYIPMGKRVMNTVESNITMGLFPSDDYIEVVPHSGDSEMARAVGHYMKWELEKNAKARREISLFARSYTRYGNGVIKFGYHKERRYEVRRGVPKGMSEVAMQLIKQLSTGPTRARPQYVNYEGIRWSNRNIRNFYAFPSNISHLDEASVVFEDFDVSLAQAEELARAGIWKLAKDQDIRSLLSSEPKNDTTRQHDANMNKGLDLYEQAAGTKHGLGGTISEVWTYMPVPPRLYTPEERPGCYVPVKIHMSGTVVLSITRNPWAHQRPPYLFHSREMKTGHLWGTGYGDIIRGLQYLINDTANQVNDVGNYTLNPVTLFQAGAVAGNRPLSLKPGAAWFVNDINGVKFDRPSAELIQYGMNIFQMWNSVFQDVGGAPPIMQGTGGGKMGKTATGAQLLQHNLSIPIRDEVEDIEQNILTPGLFRSWLLCQQFRDEEVMAVVAGQAIKITPDMLAMDADFRWLASSQAANSQQRAQQAMQLVQVVVPIVQLLMQSGYQVDFVPLIQRIYSDGFGFRGFDKFIARMQMAPSMGMPGMPAPGMPGPGPGMPGEEMAPNAGMSAIPGAEGGPGEGEAFADVRDQADLAAAGLGAAMGGVNNIRGEE